MPAIDDAWFKRRHHDVGVSQRAACRRMGRSPTFLSRVYSGDQALKIDEARQLAKILDAPLNEVLQRAGLTMPFEVVDAPSSGGLCEASVEPRSYSAQDALKTVQAQGPDQTVWRVRGNEMRLAGYLDGDEIVVCTRSRPRRDDAVIAQIYSRDGTAETVFRLAQPPYLVRPGVDPSPLLVDDRSVLIRGTVIASRRLRRMD